MNCHGENKVKQETHKHSPLKHMLHMIICCGLPVLILAFLPLITRISPNTGSFIGKVIPFLCPVMMISMMVLMMSNGSKGENCCDKEDDNSKLLDK